MTRHMNNDTSKIKNNQHKIKTSNNTYLVSKWNVIKAFNNVPYFGKTIGLPIAQLISKGEASVEEALPEALLILFHNLEETSPEELITKILEGTYSYNTKQQVDLETDFDGDIGEVLELCAAVFKLQYGSLFAKKALASFTEMAGGMNALQS